MVSPHPWLRGELPWLRSGPLYRVDPDGEAELTAFLDRAGYVRVELDGSRMTSLSAAHDELARGFGFPDYYGRNWDAFNDCLRDYFDQHAGQPLGVIWRNLTGAGPEAAATTAEVGWALLSIHTSYFPSWSPDEDHRVAADVFVLGSGQGFDGP